MQLRYLIVSMVVVGSAAVASAQTVPADFTKARNERVEALAKGDKAGFDRLTTANFVVVDPAGRVENKTERMGRVTPVASPNPGALNPQRTNERTVLYNNDTVVLFWQQMTPQGVQNFMETWVKDGGQWKCAAAHISRPAGGGGREGGREGGRSN